MKFILSINKYASILGLVKILPYFFYVIIIKTIVISQSFSIDLNEICFKKGFLLDPHKPAALSETNLKKLVIRDIKGHNQLLEKVETMSDAHQIIDSFKRILPQLKKIKISLRYFSIEELEKHCGVSSTIQEIFSRGETKYRSLSSREKGWQLETPPGTMQDVVNYFKRIAARKFDDEIEDLLHRFFTHTALITARSFNDEFEKDKIHKKGLESVKERCERDIREIFVKGSSEIRTRSHFTIKHSEKISKEEIIFEEIPIPLNQDCGFEALGISRKKAIRILLGKAGDDKVRSLLIPEIRTLFQQGELTAILLEVNPDLFAEYTTLYKLYIDMKSQPFINLSFRQALNSKIEEFCKKESIFKELITTYYGTRGWLTVLPNMVISEDASSMLDAIAYVFKLNIYVWKNAENIFQLIHKALYGDVMNSSIHVLHRWVYLPGERRVHFTRLSIVSQKKENTKCYRASVTSETNLSRSSSRIISATAAPNEFSAVMTDFENPHASYNLRVNKMSHLQDSELQWRSSTNTVRLFQKSHIGGNQTNYSFAAIGIDREKAITLLQGYTNEEWVRTLIKPDILARLLDLDDKKQLSSELTLLRKRFRDRHNELMCKIEGTRSQINQELGFEGKNELTREQVVTHIFGERRKKMYGQDLTELNAIIRETDTYTPTQYQINAFLQNEFIENNECLTYYHDGGGTLEALARIMKIGVTILVGEKNLKQVFHVPAPEDTSPHYYLHHVDVNKKGRVFLDRFNLLYQISSEKFLKKEVKCLEEPSPKQSDEAEFRWLVDPNTGSYRFFNESRVDGNQGNCGFIAIGTDREAAISLLISHAENEQTRQLMTLEILDLVTNPLEVGQLPEILNTLRYRFYNERVALVQQLEAQRYQINEELELSGSENQLTLEETRDYLLSRQDQYRWAQAFNDNLQLFQRIAYEMEHFISSPEQLKTFVQYEFGERHGYLSYFRGGGGTLEAIARLLGAEVFVFDGDSDLTQTLYVPPGLGNNHKYFLHHVGGKNAKGRSFLNHFNILVEKTIL